MAKIKKGILGGISGSVGNIVGFHRQGNDYIRTKPANVRNPNTEAQQVQRLKFRLMIALLKSIKGFVNQGFKFVTGNRSAFSAAMSVNIRQAFSGEFPNLSVDPSKLVLARGSRYSATEFALDLSVAGSATLTWTSDINTSEAEEDDIVMVLLYNTINGEVAYRLNGGSRSDEMVTLTIPPGWSGDDIAGFLAFRAADETSVSNSVYTGTETAA